LKELDKIPERWRTAQSVRPLSEKRQQYPLRIRPWSMLAAIYNDYGNYRIISGSTVWSPQGTLLTENKSAEPTEPLKARDMGLVEARGHDRRRDLANCGNCRVVRR
jgi:hypothetical protein